MPEGCKKRETSLCLDQGIRGSREGAKQKQIRLNSTDRHRESRGEAAVF